jgi:hypothetical protein
MTNAEQQAYEVMLNYWILRALQYEHLAHVQNGYIEGIETLIIINRLDAVEVEIEKAKHYFDKVTRESAA